MNKNRDLMFLMILVTIGLSVSCNDDIANAKTNKVDNSTAKNTSTTKAGDNSENNVATTEKKEEIHNEIDSFYFPEPTTVNYDTAKKYVYLSFDDGPQNGTTACVDVCKKAGMKATFFMVGQHASSPHLKSIVKNIRKSYPLLLLANHSTTHASNKYKYFYHNEEMAAKDFMKAQTTLNVPYKIIRLCGNTSWVRENQLRANDLTKPVCKILDSLGYNVLGWDVEWNFGRKTANPVESPERLMKIVENAFAQNKTNTKNHLVILTHDRMFRNQNYTDSLTKFINLLQQHQNYVFETLDHYPGLKKLK